jgi:hypothetical protein
MIPADVRLYTWIDVEDVLLRRLESKEGWPDWLVDARVYWDELSVRVQPGRVANAIYWLRDVLDPRGGCGSVTFSE